MDEEQGCVTGRHVGYGCGAFGFVLLLLVLAIILQIALQRTG